MSTRDPYSSGASVLPAIPTGTADTPDQGRQAPGAETQGVVEQARQTTSELVDQAKETAKPRLESQKERAAGSLGSAAHALRQTGRQLRDQDEGGVAQFADRAAEQIERFSDYLRTRDVDDLIGEAERIARRQPVFFLGGAFLLGVVGSRFLKASSQRARSRREQVAPSGDYVPPPRYASALPTERSEGAAVGTTSGYEAGTRDDYPAGLEEQTPGYEPGTRTGRTPGLEER